MSEDSPIRGFATKRGTPLTDIQLQGILNNLIETSINFYTDRYSRARIEAEQYYRADPSTMPSQPGRSKIISRDVAESIDTILPGLMHIYSDTGNVVRFIPQKPQDEAYARQARDWCNYVWNVKNDGFKTFYHWFKSALMFRLGILKIWWDTEKSVSEEEYENLSPEEYAELQMDPEVEIDRVRVEPDPDALELALSHMELLKVMALSAPEGPQQEPPPIDPKTLPKVYSVSCTRVTERGFINIKPVPSEEFLFGQYKQDLRDREFIAHRRRMRASQLRELGYREELIRQIPFGSARTIPYLQEKWVRHDKETTWPWAGSEGLPNDPSRLQRWVVEAYCYIDADGDGVAEYHKIVAAGEGKYIILEDQIVDAHPFRVISPILMPFKLVGQSLTDQTIDLQQVRTTVLRQILDNFYLSNHQRLVVNRSVKMDDILNPRPGAPVRVDGAPSDSVMPLRVQPMAQEGLALLQYTETIREQRTGVRRMNQGMNPDLLQDVTATSANLLTTAGNQRQELIARAFGIGVADAFRRILDLSVKHHTKEEIIQLRGQWVPMRPSDWRRNYDVTCEVGLGRGNRDQQLAHLGQFLPIIQNLVQLQAQMGGGGVQGPIIDLKNIYNFLTKMAEYANLKSPEQYFTDPSGFIQQQRLQAQAQAQAQAQQGPQPQQMPPEMQIKQMELMEKKREFDAKHQLRSVKTQGDLQLRRQQIMQDFHTRMQELDLEALKIKHGDDNARADREVSALDIHHKTRRDNLRADMEALAIHHDDQNKAHQRDMDALALHHANRNARADRTHDIAQTVMDHMMQPEPMGEPPSGSEPKGNE